MQPDGEVTDPGLEGEAAPDSQAIETPQSEASSPISMAEALAQARAAAESPAPTSSEEPGEQPASSEHAGTEGDSAAAETPTSKGPRERLFTEKAALQRALDFQAQGREAELSPEARGILRKYEKQIIERHETRRSEDEEFKDLWLQLEAARVEDPAEWARLTVEHPKAREHFEFYHSYRLAHPEVSLDTPNPSAKQRSEQDILAEVATAYGQGFEQTLDAIADEADIDPAKYQALKAEFSFGKHPDSANLATFMAKMVSTVAEAMVKPLLEKEVAKVKAAEKKAYDLQLQTYKTQAQQTPRSMPAGVMDPRKARTQADPSRPFSLRDALAEAKEALAAG